MNKKEREAERAKSTKELKVATLAVILMAIAMSSILALEHANPRSILITALVLLAIGGASLFVLWLIRMSERNRLEIDWEKPTIG